MPTAKPQYKGDGSKKPRRDFTARLKKQLREFYSDQNAETDPTFGHPADEFVNEVLAEAQWVIDSLDSLRLAVTKQEARAEFTDLLKYLKKTRDKLRNLSPDVDRLMGPDADPCGVADSIATLIARIEEAISEVSPSRKNRRYDEVRRQIALEMSVNVLRVLEEHSIPVVTTTSRQGVKILKLIGDDVGLVLAETTWRDIVAETKMRIAKTKEHIAEDKKRRMHANPK